MTTEDEVMRIIRQTAPARKGTTVATFTLTIETNNAAFEGDGKYEELPRILREAADRIEGGDLLGTTKVRDVNGNTVGEYQYDDRR